MWGAPDLEYISFLLYIILSTRNLPTQNNKLEYNDIFLKAEYVEYMEMLVSFLTKLEYNVKWEQSSG